MNDYRNYYGMEFHSINDMQHYGVLGMRWGRRRYQPYPDGSMRDAAKAKYKDAKAEYKEAKKHKKDPYVEKYTQEEIDKRDDERYDFDQNYKMPKEKDDAIKKEAERFAAQMTGNDKSSYSYNRIKQKFYDEAYVDEVFKEMDSKYPELINKTGLENYKDSKNALKAAKSEYKAENKAYNKQFKKAEKYHNKQVKKAAKKATKKQIRKMKRRGKL